MWFVLYLVAFWTFAFAFIIVRSAENDEITLATARMKQTPRFVTMALKVVPAGLATLFMLLLRPSSTLFYVLMAIGLFFCLLGDIGMEIGLLPGIGFFAIAHIVFTIAFFSQSLALGISTVAILLTGIAIIGLAAYFVLFLRYLQSREQGLGKFRIPVLFYSLVISMMMCSSLFLLITSGSLQGIVVTGGAIIFAISDSLIAIREFHHRLSRATIKIIGTYYLAIFLLSLNILVYIF